MLDVLMLVADVVWWAAVVRLTKRRLWRVLGSIFLAAQIAAAAVLIGKLELAREIPKAVVSAVIIWHYFASSALLLGIAVWAGVWLFRCARRRSGKSQPAAAAAPENSWPWTRREFVGSCAALAPPLFTVGLTAAAQAQLDWLRVRRFTVSLPALPKALDGTSIVQVSDTHVGGLTTNRVLQRAVEQANALRPDLVVMTGDLINYELSDLSEAIALTKRFESRYGLWLIEGNHDVAVDGGEFRRRVTAAGLPLLLNDTAVVEVRGCPVQLFGLRWISGWVGDNATRDRLMKSQLRDVMRHRRPDAFPILLTHHPHAFDAAVRAELPLTLAGHTHGGQWMLSRQCGVGSVLFRYWSGLYRREGSYLIVSNGVGNWLPLRVNAPAELIHVTLRAA